MASDIWEYFEERCDECERYGLERINDPQFVETAGSDGKAGRLIMRLRMTENADIAVTERVEVGGIYSYVHRIEYGYYLMINGEDYFARDFDRRHGYHGHGVAHVRVEAERVSFKEFVEMAWEIVGTEESLARDEE